MSQRIRFGATEEEHAIDQYVGKRLKARRTLVGISQEKLGAECGVTFQQVQKYESGGNRVSASKLYQIARVLGVGPGFFFEGLPDTTDATAESDPMKSNAAIDLVKLFNRCTEADQATVMALLRSLATTGAAIAARGAV